MNRFITAICGLLTIGLLGLGISAPTAAQVAANLTADCVTDFDPDVDYFPDKISVTYAENFSVEYANHYKIVSVTGGQGDSFDYVLLQCGTPAPDETEIPEGAQIIEIPTGRTVTLSTTQTVHLLELGLLDRLVGMDSFLYVNAPEVRELIAADTLVEVSPNFAFNVELALDTDPDLIMTDDFDRDRLVLLQESGIAAAVNTEYLESSPLGRAEWLKYTALFYNAEADANANFEATVSAYEDAVALASDIPEDEQPRVLWNTFLTFTEAWTIPGGETYAGQLTRDAGGRIALVDLAPEDSTLLAFEVVYEGGLDADIWLLNAFGVASLADLVAQDSRYADFAPYQTGEVWNNDLSVNENGGNNYFELGVIQPQLILLDLIAIFHPELLPDHEFVFFRRLS